MIAAEWLVRALLLYAVCGFIFGVVFVALGVNRMDPVAKDAGWGFRLIILPGAAALWPLLLKRWLS